MSIMLLNRNRLQSISRLAINIMNTRFISSHRVRRNNNFMRSLKSRNNNPRRENTQDRESKINPNTNEMICVALRLHTIIMLAKHPVKE
jgi:hypothetical protein